MPHTTSKVKTPLGMQTLDFWPISAEPATSHPTYGQSVNLGAAVKGYLSVTTTTASIVGDNIEQFFDEFFASGQLDTETTMSDLQINATLFGHSYSEADGEESKSSDSAVLGGVSFIQPILRKDRTTIYRATCLRKLRAISSSEKQEADTRKPGEFSPKMNVVSFKVMEDNTRSWRVRNDFATVEEATAFIQRTFGAAAQG